MDQFVNAKPGLREVIQVNMDRFAQGFNMRSSSINSKDVPIDADWGLARATFTSPAIPVADHPAEDLSKTLIDSICGILESEGAVQVVNIYVAHSDGLLGAKVTYEHRVNKGLVERRQEDRRTGGDGQQGGNHYAAQIDPWELQRVMKSSGNAFVDARRADVIKYAWRMKGDGAKLLEDLKKARHCVDAAITELEKSLKPT